MSPRSILIFALSLGSFVHASSSSTAVRRRSQADGGERIVGGEVAEFGAYEYFALYLYSLGSFCGGSLIHPDIVLTAAHCFIPSQGGVIGKDIYVGGKKPDRSDAEIFTINEARIHPEYLERSGGIYNDFMLLKLDSPSSAPIAAFNERATVPQTGSLVKTIGFGHMEYGGESSVLLREVNVDVVDFDTCDSSYGGSLKSDEHICAAAIGKDACQNDSGGPLIQNGVVVGVVSFGQGCAERSFPGIYAKTSGASDFIKKGICDMSSTKPAYCIGMEGLGESYSLPTIGAPDIGGGTEQYCPQGFQIRELLDLLRLACCFGGARILGDNLCSL